MSQSNSSSSGGVGLGGLLTVLFVGLKLGHVIDWSWVWVLSPLWISVALALVMFLIFAVVAGVFVGWRSR